MSANESAGRQSPASAIDLEKEEREEPHMEDPHMEAIHTTPTHVLQRSDTTKSTHPLEQVESHRTYSGFRWVLVCVAMYASALLYGLDNTIVADIQAPIIETFGNVEELAWLGIGFPLGSIAVILAIGKCYGIFDIKWVYILSLLNFIGGSALCGGAPSMTAEIVGRVWAGFGGAGMYLGVLNVMSLNTTPAERSIYIAGCALIWGVGCILGPVIGGSLADSGAGWRWAFYINLIIFGAASPIILFVLEPYNPDPHSTFGEKLKRLDWVGIVLNAAIYVTFVMAFTFGGAQWDWKDGRTIAVIVVFGVLVILFGIQQTFSIFTTPEARIFPIDFLKSRTLVLQYIAMSATATALFIPIYYIPIYFAFTRDDSALSSAVRLLPFMCVAIFFFMFNGVFMPKVGYYAPWFLVAGVFMVISGSLFYTMVHATTSVTRIYGFSVLAAIGAGFAGQASYSVAQSMVPVHRIADAVGYINQAQIGSIAISLTITGAVFQNIGFHHIASAVEGLNFTDQDIHAALAGAKSAIFTSADDEVKARVIAGIVKAINDGYILMIVAGVVAIISASLMKYERIFLEMTAGG